MSVRTKPGVNPAGLHPRLKDAITLFADVTRQVAGEDTVVTSLCDGVHGPRSYHYLLGAADLRSKHLSAEEKHEVLRKVRERLGSGWDVLLEHEGGPNEHYHVEWDAGREELLSYLGTLQEAFCAEINRRLGESGDPTA